MKSKVCSIAIIIIASALAGWGAVNILVLVWVFLVGDFSGEGAVSGFSISIGLLGIIPLAIGAVLFLQRKFIVERIAGPGE